MSKQNFDDKDHMPHHIVWTEYSSTHSGRLHCTNVYLNQMIRPKKQKEKNKRQQIWSKSNIGYDNCNYNIRLCATGAQTVCCHPYPLRDMDSPSQCLLQSESLLSIAQWVSGWVEVLKHLSRSMFKCHQNSGAVLRWGKSYSNKRFEIWRQFIWDTLDVCIYVMLLLVIMYLVMKVLYTVTLCITDHHDDCVAAAVGGAGHFFSQS